MTLGELVMHITDLKNHEDALTTHLEKYPVENLEPWIKKTKELELAIRKLEAIEVSPESYNEY